MFKAFVIRRINERFGNWSSIESKMSFDAMEFDCNDKLNALKNLNFICRPVLDFCSRILDYVIVIEV